MALMDHSYFNSIKVQLKLALLLPKLLPLLIFQFHKGTIKARRPPPACRSPPQFQFHKGTIKAKCSLFLSSHKTNFNSIKVQLKPEVPEPAAATTSVFQFHKGTIKALSFYMRQYLLLISIP